jgi:sec-independent protein translocase protein TatA
MIEKAMLGSQDLIIGLVLVLFFFGAKRLPEMASSLGKSMKEFKKAVAGSDEEEEAKKAAPPPAAAGPRLCAGCQSPLEPGWSHCPRCGARAPETPEPVPPASRS